ncbi:hypothetical protein YC2023_100348 [Brassica napus]
MLECLKGATDHTKIPNHESYASAESSRWRIHQGDELEWSTNGRSREHLYSCRLFQEL